MLVIEGSTTIAHDVADPDLVPFPQKVLARIFEETAINTTTTTTNNSPFPSARTTAITLWTQLPHHLLLDESSTLKIRNTLANCRAVVLDTQL